MSSWVRFNGAFYFNSFPGLQPSDDLLGLLRLMTTKNPGAPLLDIKYTYSIFQFI